MADIEFMAAIQGHYQVLDEQNPELKRSLVSSRHYNDYKIGDGKGNIDGRQGIKLSAPGVSVIEIFANQPLLIHCQLLDFGGSMQLLVAQLCLCLLR